MISAKITRLILRKLRRPAPDSHKGDNGRLLIIAGSKKYHGSLALGAGMAAKIADLVYVHSAPENFEVVKKLRPRLAEFIFVSAPELAKTLLAVDAVLIGPGLLPNERVRRLVNGILRRYSDKKIILDAGALRVCDSRLLRRNCIITPHAGEFQAMFGLKAAPETARAMSEKYPAVMVLKGPTDYVCQGGRMYYNVGGNAGLTKGGTGDVLAGLIAGLAATNDALTAAKAGVWVNKAAGDRLYKKFGFYYSASELIPAARAILGGK